MSAELESLVESLRAEVARLRSEVRALQDPRGRLFLADESNPGSTNRSIIEIIPNAAGNDLDVLTDGRTVSGTTDPGVFLAIPGLDCGEAAYYGFANGTNSIYVRISEQLRLGKVQSLGDCNANCIVKRCKENGDLLDNILVTVYPAFGATAEGSANGFVVDVGDVIAYMPIPGDPAAGVQVGAYKSVSLGYRCSDSSSASVPGLDRLTFYPGDFLMTTESTCGGVTNQGNIFALGLTALRYGLGNVDNIKVLDLAAGAIPDPSGTEGTDFSTLAWHSVSNTTTVRVPTIGGAPCTDETNPNALALSIRAKIGSAVSSIDSIACNEDGTITANYSTMRVLIPIT